MALMSYDRRPVIINCSQHGKHMLGILVIRQHDEPLSKTFFACFRCVQSAGLPINGLVRPNEAFLSLERHDGFGNQPAA